MKEKLPNGGARSWIIIVGLIMLLQRVGYAGGSKIISVEEFGARGDGQTNSYAAIKAALKEAGQDNEKVIVQFGPGKYIITPEKPAGIDQIEDTDDDTPLTDDQLYKQSNVLRSPNCFEMAGVDNLTIQGDPDGTELVIGSPTADVLRLNNSTNISVKDLTIDYDPLPFTQGTIVAVDKQEGSFDLDLDEGFPSLSTYWLKGADAKWGYALDREGLFRLGGCSAVFSKSWKHIKNRIWRLKLAKPEQVWSLLMGDRFAHLGRTNGKAAFFFIQCTNVSVKNVTVYSNSSSAMTFFRCEGELVVDGLVVRTRPGTERLVSTNADAVHCNSNRKGPLIENCLLEGFGDDAMNFYTGPSVVTRILAGNQIEVNTTQILRAGDKVQILDPRDGMLKGEGLTVTEVDNQVLTFDKNVDNLHVGRKGYLDSDTVYNLSACSGGFVVRKNIIGGFRGRGMVVRGGNGTIENNLIKDTSGAGIFIANNPMWPEGPMPFNIVIRNNLIWGVGRDNGYKTSAAFIAAGYQQNWQPSRSRGVRGIMIENNIIIDPPFTAIRLQSTENVTVRNNMVEIIKGWPGLEQYQGIVMENCENVLVERFMMTDPQRRIAAGITIDPAGSTKSKNIELKGIKADISKDGKLIKK